MATSSHKAIVGCRTHQGRRSGYVVEHDPTNNAGVPCVFRGWAVCWLIWSLPTLMPLGFTLRTTSSADALCTGKPFCTALMYLCYLCYFCISHIAVIIIEFAHYPLSPSSHSLCEMFPAPFPVSFSEWKSQENGWSWDAVF